MRDIKIEVRDMDENEVEQVKELITGGDNGD